MERLTGQCVVWAGSGEEEEKMNQEKSHHVIWVTDGASTRQQLRRDGQLKHRCTDEVNVILRSTTAVAGSIRCESKDHEAWCSGKKRGAPAFHRNLTKNDPTDPVLWASISIKMIQGSPVPVKPLHDHRSKHDTIHFLKWPSLPLRFFCGTVPCLVPFVAPMGNVNTLPLPARPILSERAREMCVKLLGVALGENEDRKMAKSLESAIFEKAGGNLLLYQKTLRETHLCLIYAGAFYIPLVGTAAL
ncbi:hypothetical protein B0H10DRAFT_2195095 [Mycena sp. CBHHK59/15]|nr:hypothetical protein B0H10DRAFT_2195095 [Mycena sp. CBHHK59/15]